MTKDVLEQDNDTWQPIGLATARLLVKLGDDEQRDRERDAAEKTSDQEKPRERADAIEHGLRRIREFERRYRSK